MRSATLLDLLPPPCAGDPRRNRFAARLVARSLRELQLAGGSDEECLTGAERLAQRIGGEPSLSGELDALRAAIARARARRTHTAQPPAHEPETSTCIPRR